MHYELHTSDATRTLRTLKDNSIDTCITDPPYGLSSTPDITEVLTHWLNGDDYEHGKSGFMHRGWDSFVPGPSVWREVYRALKPGGYLLAFGGTRTFDLLSIAIRIAGFEIVDQIAWLHASGFPHGINISKALDKNAGAEREVVTECDTIDTSEKHATAPTTSLAAQFDGYNSALAPSHEPILVAMKPRDGTYANNAKTWGVSGLNIDGCRIAVDSPRTISTGRSNKQRTAVQSSVYGTYAKWDGKYKQVGGRYPKNTILQHTPECTRISKTKVEGDPRGDCDGKRPGGFGDAGADSGDSKPNARVYGNEAVDQWQCAPHCPVHMLAEQTGEHPGCASPSNAKPESIYRPEQGAYQKQGPIYPGTRTATRFFYQAKASKRERNIGCNNLYWKRDGNSEIGYVRVGFDEWEQLPHQQRSQGNIHPTVKPVDLVSYLVRLTRPPEGGIVLDPFSGSGTTGMACVIEGRDYIGIELNADYNIIARRRIERTRRDHQTDQWRLF